MEPLLYLKAFAVGGLLCVAGQLLLSLTRLTSARVLVLFVTLGVVLGALGWYQPLVEFAGAGATGRTARSARSLAGCAPRRAASPRRSCSAISFRCCRARAPNEKNAGRR